MKFPSRTRFFNPSQLFKEFSLNAEIETPYSTKKFKLPNFLKIAAGMKLTLESVNITEQTVVQWDMIAVDEEIVILFENYHVRCQTTISAIVPEIIFTVSIWSLLPIVSYKTRKHNQKLLITHPAWFSHDHLEGRRRINWVKRADLSSLYLLSLAIYLLTFLYRNNGKYTTKWQTATISRNITSFLECKLVDANIDKDCFQKFNRLWTPAPVCEALKYSKKWWSYKANK